MQLFYASVCFKMAYRYGGQPVFLFVLTAEVQAHLLSFTVQRRGPLVFPIKILKGTVQRDFLTPVFFTKQLILVSIDMPQSDFEIFRILTELRGVNT
jgi:hypothetical protein